MEKGKEIDNNTIFNLYKDYSEGKDISKELKDYKDINLWIDILALFGNYKNTFPSENIINAIIPMNIFDEGILLNYLLNEFIDYFYSLNIKPTKDLFKQSQSSYFRFIISTIINNNDDRIDNYKAIMANLKSIDDYYELDLNALFKDFINYCVEYIQNDTQNMDTILYPIKIFDFFSKIRDSNKNDEFYLFIKPLLFDIKSYKIIPKLEINKYKNSKEIKDDIILILNNNENFGNIEYEYLKFIKMCFVPEKELNNKEFKILYFDLLNTEKLQLFIQESKINEIKNYNLTKILSININIINENSPNDKNIDTNNIINANITNNSNENIQNNNNSDKNINKDINIINKVQNKNNIDKDIKNNNINIETNNNIITNIQNNININEIKNISNENITNNINDNTKINKSIISLNKNIINNDIENDIDLDKQKNEIINDSEIISSLKDDLTPLTIKNYFKEQIKKYSKELTENSIFKNLKINETFKIKNYVHNYIKKETFPFVYAIYSDIINYINNNINKNYNKKFGFIVIDNIEYIYTYHNDEIINNFLFESNKIKKYNYDDILDISSKDSYRKDKSYKSLNITNKISKNNYSYKSVKSYKISHNILNYDNKNNEIDLKFLKGFEFENNSTYWFENLFNLKHLPNYFFPLTKKKINKKDKKEKDKKNKEKKEKDKKNKEFVTFSDYDNNLFSTFLETDGAYINDKDENLKPKFKNNFHPFLIQKTFEVYKVKEEYKLKSIEEDFEIASKTIIINESKLSIPKNIEKFDIDEEYDKNLLSNTLIFTLNKLIKKKHYYKELVEKEFLKNSKDIEKYKFLFCLIYNNIPIENIEDIAENDLQVLINEKYIEDIFKLKIIYLIPNLGTYNLKSFQNDINIKLDNKEKQHKEEINQLRIDLENQNQNQINQLKNQNQNQINQLKNEHQNQINQLKNEHQDEINKLRKDLENQNQATINELTLKYNLISIELENLRKEMDEMKNKKK